MNEALRDELLAMAAADLQLRSELLRDGSLFQGYNPRMRALHQQNAARLQELLDAGGWPLPEQVGQQASDAAWLVLQHAIGSPALQRRGLLLLQQAAAEGNVPALQVAMLEDRILCMEGKPQRHGTQFDWDLRGVLAPLPMDDPTAVDARRKALGLCSLEEETQHKRAQAQREGEQVPRDLAARRREQLQWLVETGWRQPD
jgi:hypothetical protein